MLIHTFRKPDGVRNDFMPVSSKGFVLFAIGLSLAFRCAGYLLSSDGDAVTGGHDWIYHAFWLPMHLFLARHAAIAFSRNADACMAHARSDRHRDELRRRVAYVTSLRGWLASLVLVVPFVFLDSVAGVAYVHENFQAQGYAAALMPVIWLIEWLATAQIWLYVLGSIYFNSEVLSEAGIAGRHEAILIHGEARAPLLCGVENAFIIAVYGLSTIGYVWYANGQVSDFLVMAISTVLVLVCFFSALLQLKTALRRSLDSGLQDFQRLLSVRSMVQPGGIAEGEEASSHVPYADFKEAVSFVFEKKSAKNAKVEERLRGIRLAVLLALPAGTNRMHRDLYSSALLLLECETRLHEFGATEIKAVSLRAGMPIFVILGKSAGGLIGVH